MGLREIITELCGISGPSGFETPVASRAKELLSERMDDVTIDVMSNVVGVKHCGRPGVKKLLLDAHLDEVGLIVTKTEKGFLRFAAIGGVDPRMLPAREVLVLTEPPLKGFVACMPPHVLSDDDMDKGQPIDEMLIDVGLCEEEAEKRVRPGTPVVFVGGAEALGEDCICGKSLDDRACFAIILRALELIEGKDIGVDLYVMGSAQEEIGLRGAKTGVFAIDPDLSVAVDVTHAATPDSQKEITVKLGGGAVVCVGPNMNKALSDHLLKVAREKEIKHQVEVLAGATGTNGWVISVNSVGVPTAELALPLRYMHSPVETMKLSDGEAVAELLAEFILGIGEVL